MNVFIGGSRAVSRLSASIRGRIDDLTKRGCTILIGDANGADEAVQKYLAERQYPRVIVFCMEHCRNNIGGWPTRNVEPPSERKGITYYAAKDLAMSREAKCGLMLWDGKSKGTLNNILNLLAAEKRTLVYFAPTRDFHVLASQADLQALLGHCQKRDLDIAARGLGLKTPLTQAHLPLSPL
jgi:hypothetical protein